MDYVEETDCYCEHCDDYTTQLRKYDTHERDSSHDCFICLVCKWEYNGYNGKWEAPREFS